MKLLKIAAYFDYIRDEEYDESSYSEQRCYEVLQNLEIEQFETITDIPVRFLEDFFLDLIGGDRYTKMDPNQEQDLLDLLEECTMNKVVNVIMIAKIFRYLLRKDTSKKSALLVVDVQNDFISGSLALKNSPAHQDGEEVVEVINTIIENHDFDLVVYTIDWHPEDHCSFITNVDKYPLHETSPVTAEEAKLFDKVIYDGETVIEQVLWPEHCVKGSEGAEFHPDLKLLEEGEKSIRVFKGTQRLIDSYSAFWDNGRLAQTDLFVQLLDRDITTVFTCGLATDFCVAYTALDSNKHGFQTFVVDDGCRGVCDDSIEGMKSKQRRGGIKIIEASAIADTMAS